MVDDDEATREEELGHQRDAPAVGRNDRRPLGRRVVGAAVGRAGEAVDDPARAEAGGGLRPADRPREAAAPESLGSDRPVECLHALALQHRASLGLGVRLHHRGRELEALDREVAPANLYLPPRRPGLALPVEDRDAPRVGAWLLLEVEPHQRRVAARVGEERQRTAVQRPLDRGALGHVLHVEPGDVADPGSGGMPGDVGALRRRRRAEQRDDGRAAGQRGPKDDGEPQRSSVTRSAADAGTARSRRPARPPAEGRFPGLARRPPAPRRRATRAS